MGLSVAGYFREAELAYQWMASTQFPDGSWWSATRNGAPEDATKDSNLSSYIAVGVYHHFLITADVRFLRRLWPTLEAGIDYAVGLQADTGEIHWARNGQGIIDPMALLTGSSSVFMSLKCALAVASVLGTPFDWEKARRNSGGNQESPESAQMMKARYSMDWYYPSCAAPLRRRCPQEIDRSWDKFVVPEWGCAASATTLGHHGGGLELVLTLTAIGDHKGRPSSLTGSAIEVDDGPTGRGDVSGRVICRRRRPPDGGAVLLAHDALREITRQPAFLS